MDILVFAPHPDDDILGCGGSIINHIKRGNAASIIYLTSGEAANPKIKPQKLLKIREGEAEKACQILGVSNLKVKGF